MNDQSGGEFKIISLLNLHNYKLSWLTCIDLADVRLVDQ